MPTAEFDAAKAAEEATTGLMHRAAIMVGAWDRGDVRPETLDLLIREVAQRAEATLVARASAEVEAGKERHGA